MFTFDLPVLTHVLRSDTEKQHGISDEKSFECLLNSVYTAQQKLQTKNHSIRDVVSELEKSQASWLRALDYGWAQGFYESYFAAISFMCELLRKGERYMQAAALGVNYMERLCSMECMPTDKESRILRLMNVLLENYLGEADRYVFDNKKMPMWLIGEHMPILVRNAGVVLRNLPTDDDLAAARAMLFASASELLTLYTLHLIASGAAPLKQILATTEQMHLGIGGEKSGYVERFLALVTLVRDA